MEEESREKRALLPLLVVFGTVVGLCLFTRPLLPRGLILTVRMPVRIVDVFLQEGLEEKDQGLCRVLAGTLVHVLPVFQVRQERGGVLGLSPRAIVDRAEPNEAGRPSAEDASERRGVTHSLGLLLDRIDKFLEFRWKRRATHCTHLEENASENEGTTEPAKKQLGLD